MKITNWGRFPVVDGTLRETDDYQQIQQLVAQNQTVIARGNGRSYGDSSLNQGNVFSTLKLNKFIEFDQVNETFTCEAGVLLADILDVIVPQGFFLPVTPGTKLITVGGAIAANVHGKNNHSEGCFGEYVTEFQLLTATGEIKHCSETDNKELFQITFGGMGLTGIILSAKFKLKRIETAFIKQRILKAKNLDEIFSYFETYSNYTYSVAWIDCLQKGKNIGRSILTVGEHATIDQLAENQRYNPLQLKKKLVLTVPFDFPSFVLNSFTVKIFNWIYYHKQIKKIVDNVTDYDSFFYPLDVINHWNRIYGKGGFIQYQFIIPKKVGKIAMTEVLQTIAKSGQGSFLAVLKLYRNSEINMKNSFPIEGYSLALDFKINKQLPKLVRKLDEIVEHYQGRIYLAKDAMSKKTLLDYVKTPINRKFNSYQYERIHSMDNEI